MKLVVTIGRSEDKVISMHEKSNAGLLSRAFKYKSVRRGFAITLVGLLIGNFFYQNHLDAVHHANEITRYRVAVSDYNEFGKKCTSVEQLPKIDYSSNSRSTKRIATATNYFYAIFNAECLILEDHKIYRNPYRNLTLSATDITSPGSIGYEAWQGLLYEVDFGVPYLATGGTLCSDGWISGSFGRGTCSWHGGYARNRGTKFMFEAVTPIHDPRPMLKKLLKQ